MHAPAPARAPATIGAARRIGSVPEQHAPLVTAAGDPAATIVLATRPGPGLRAGDRRRLTRMLQGADRRLRRAAPDPTRGVVVDGLARLAAVATEVSVGDGVALVASPGDACLLHLRHPVRSRVLVGPPPTAVDIAEAAGTPGRLGVLVVTGSGSRLLLAEGGVLRDVLGGFPLRRDGHGPASLLPAYLDDLDAALRDAVPLTLPIVVAGDERMAAAFVDRCTTRQRIAGILDGDHRSTSPAALVALAQRRLRRALTVPQRRALAEIAVARAGGRLNAGPRAVREATAAAGGPGEGALLVVEQGFRSVDDGRDPDLLFDASAAVEEAGGTVVVVPDGHLAEHGRIAVVHRDAASDREVRR